MSSIAKQLEEKRTLVLDGTYREKVDITQDKVTLIGPGTIVFDDHHGTFRDGFLFSTRHSATVTVRGKDFHAVGMTFRNDFDYNLYTAYNRKNPDARIATQSVALMLERESDNALFENCRFISLHDTLYADGKRAVFRNCYIEGNIDFIFGSGECLFENCEINIRGGSEEAFVSAPSTFIGRRGFLFRGCRFGSTDKRDYYLARPWHPAGSEDRCPEAIFEDCTFDTHLEKNPFTSMTSTRPDGRRREWRVDESRFSIR